MKTAIDNYALGKQKEIDADDFQPGSIFGSKRFTCPECGEDVFFKSSKLQNNFFSHYKRTPTTLECDRRVDVNVSMSIYERLGIPMFLRCTGDKYYLCLGFKAVPEDIMNLAESEQVSVEISGVTKYLVNQERFSIDNTTFIPVDFIPPNGQQYKITYSKGKSVGKLRKIWSDYADGFSYEGAFFTAGNYGGRKIRHCDSVATNTEYYWLRNKKYLSPDLHGIDMKLVGTLPIRHRAYYIFRGQFTVETSSEYDFRVLASFLKATMKIYLLEKQPEVIPLWPPMSRSPEGYHVMPYVSKVLCNIITGNDMPKVYSYSNTKSIPIKLNSNQLNYRCLLISLYDRMTLINVDRKMISTGILFEKRKLEISVLPFMLYEMANGEKKDLSGIHEVRNDKYIEIHANEKLSVIRIGRNGNVSEIICKEPTYQLKNIEAEENVYILSHTNVIYYFKCIREQEQKKSYFKEQILLEIILQHRGDAKIQIPVEMRNNLAQVIKTCSNPRLAAEIKTWVKINKMPVSLIPQMGGKINE